MVIPHEPTVHNLFKRTFCGVFQVLAEEEEGKPGGD